MTNYPEEMCPKAGREPISHDIIKYAAILAERANGIASRVEGKLAPVCHTASPLGNTGTEVQKSYPPFFAEVRDYLSGVDRALDSIDCTLSRCEV